MKFFIATLTCIFLAACSEPSTHSFEGVSGSAGNQTPVLRSSQGNPLGYYEYLPKDFKKELNQAYPIIFYWNGGSSISGNGKDQITNLLKQGLPQYINEGQDFPAIIISGMLDNWKKDDVHEFVEYIFKRYKPYIDPQRAYMTGFSAGGGVTVDYLSVHPERFAAFIAIAPAVAAPPSNGPMSEMAELSSWFIHNSGDMKVEIWRSNQWNRALRDIGGDHMITRPDEETHYALRKAYKSAETWEWLLSKTKKAHKPGNIK